MNRRTLIKQLKQAQRELGDTYGDGNIFVCCLLDRVADVVHGSDARRFFEAVFGFGEHGSNPTFACSYNQENKAYRYPYTPRSPGDPHYRAYGDRIIALQLAICLLNDGFTIEDFLTEDAQDDE